MAQTPYTPGPWEWSETGRLLHNVPASHSSTVLMVHDRIWRPTESDARLIAAAPELLEGAEDTLAALKLLRTGLVERAPETIEVLDAHISELEFAITKARGKTK